jgi:hypothetical protein
LAADQTDVAQEESVPEMDRGMPDVDPTTIQGEDEVEFSETDDHDYREDKRAEAGPRGSRLGEPVADVDEGEADIICIVRSRTNPSSQNNVLVIREATPELLAQINLAAAPPPDASRPAEPGSESAGKMARRPDQANRQPRAKGPALSPVRPRGPIVRGQSMR